MSLASTSLAASLRALCKGLVRPHSGVADEHIPAVGGQGGLNVAAASSQVCTPGCCWMTRCSQAISGGPCVHAYTILRDTGTKGAALAGLSLRRRPAATVPTCTRWCCSGNRPICLSSVMMASKIRFTKGAPNPPTCHDMAAPAMPPGLIKRIAAAALLLIKC